MLCLSAPDFCLCFQYGVIFLSSSLDSYLQSKFKLRKGVTGCDNIKNKGFEEFSQQFLNIKTNSNKTVEDIVYKRNLKILRVAAGLALLADIFWLIVNISKPAGAKLYENLVLIVGYLHIGFSAYITLLAFLVKKDYARPFVKCSIYLYYVFIIFHVAVYANNLCMRALEVGASTEFMGITLSTFYLFILAFAPIHNKRASIVLCILISIGCVVPAFSIYKAAYSLTDQVILRVFIISAYILLRGLNERIAVQDIESSKLTSDLLITTYTDHLTGIMNRRAMDEYWNKLVESPEIENVGVLIFDIDFFKKYNDTYSHLKGDEALQNVSSKVCEVLGNTDNFLFRYGGEEFISLIPNTTVEDLKTIAVSIVDAVYKANFPRNDSVYDRLTVTVGGEISTALEQNTETYIKEADKQLYIGKDGGKNCYVYNGVIYRP